MPCKLYEFGGKNDNLGSDTFSCYKFRLTYLQF